MSIVTTKDQVPQPLPAAGTITPVRRPAAATPPPGMTGKDFLRILRKRMLLILIVFVIIVSVVMAATAIWYFTAPSYTAKAYLAVSPPITTIITNPGAPTYSQEIIERYKRSYAALVKQPEVLKASLLDSRIQRTKWYSDNTNRAQTALEEDLDIVIIPETDMFTISMTGRNPEDLANIVETVAEVYVAKARETPFRLREDESKSLLISRNGLSERLRTLNNDRSKLSDQATAGLTRTYLMQAEAAEVLRDLNKAKRDQKDAEDAAESWKNMSDQQALESSPEIQMEISRDPQLNNLLMEEINVNNSLDNARLRFGDLHSNVQALQTRLDSVQKQITERKTLVARERIAAMRQTAAMMSARAKTSVEDLQLQYNRLQARLNDIDSSHNMIENLTSQIKDASESVSKIDARLQDLELIMRAIGGDVGPVVIRSQASTPNRPSSPSWTIMLGVGLAGGLLASIALALLLELGDTSVKTPSDIIRRVDLPLLGMVPHSDDLAEEISDFRRVAQLAPHSPAAEAIRQIRTNLLFSGPAEHRRSVLITSPAPQDGRTTVVLNLAFSLAQSGRRVLVVDAIFRQPAIAALFPQAPPAGLSSALVEQVQWRDVVYKTDIANLSVVASGPLPPNPADLLSSPAMRKMVQEMTAEYDQVIFDGSPTTLVADASVLATQVDGVILVVRAGANSVGIVQRSAEQLHRVGARVLGVVLQGVRITAGGYLRKNYESFYEYHQKPLP
jgi:capsular exopolysaccharide synthesis family protein